MKDMVTVVCYGKEETMTRKEAISKYEEAAMYCEGSEQDRYIHILVDLATGKTRCTDG